MKITVAHVEFEELCRMAVDVHNEYYEARAEKAGNFHIEIKMEDVPEDILQEWMIALIQDEMVTVEGAELQQISTKIAILQEIKRVYPQLTPEVDRHLEIFASRK
ncbi:MAG: hypothetical protein J6K75_06715 [Erysipelotrichaceae bacterium]|nr:hypothetical protein [Erysipelotrichaceae bacterium]MBQ7890332.1 hypothetical protein [Erysipelotrichaceae bacterium]